MKRRSPRSLLVEGTLGFIVTTYAATWSAAWLFRDAWPTEAVALSTRMLLCSLVYVVMMGWQPLLAVLLTRMVFERTGRPLDAGLRVSKPRFLLLGALLPWAAICGAWLAQTWLEGSEPWTMAPAAAPTSLGTGLWRIVAVVLTYVVIYVQCLVEETAWRGYFLVRAMELLGPWKGLALHGIVWGLWYAPILMFVNGNLHAQPLRGAGFVVTCMLLGFVLGWLRLASRSIAPAVIANLILTLGAGLPIVLSGEDPGSQSAVFFPIGWIPLALIALVIGTTSARRAVVTPHLPLVARAQGDRLLH